MKNKPIYILLLFLALSCANLLEVNAAKVEYEEDGTTYERIVGRDGKDQTETVDGHKLYHVKITKTTAKNLVIYNDIGSVYNYRTIFIDNSAFNGNPTIETVTFEDVISKSANVYQYLDMSWGNSCFANCPNLRAIYMKYHVTTSGEDKGAHTVMIRPEWVRPEGDKIFDDSPNVKIFVDAEYYDDYCKDPYWSKYKNILVPTTDMRDYCEKQGGAKYDYDRNRNATYTPQKTKPNLSGNPDPNKDVLLQHIAGADDDYLAKNEGNLWIYNDVGNGYAGRTTKVWTKAFYGNANLRHINVQDVQNGKAYSHVNITLGDSAFANCENLHVLDLVYKKNDGTTYSALNPNQIVLAKDGVASKGVFANCPNLIIRVAPENVDTFCHDTENGWGEYADRIVGYFDEPTGGDSYKGLKYSYIYKQGSKDYYTNDDNEGMKAYLEKFSTQITSSSFRADSLLADRSVNRKVVYYKFIGGSDASLVDKEKGVMTIVNDFGASYNYRTIAISPTAFCGKENVKSIQFQDLPDNYACETYYPLRLAIPDGAFKGCKNLQALNMYYYVTKGDNHYEVLGPENIYIGKNVFDGCSDDFTIRVAPERLQDFLDDPDWARYKEHIRAWEYAPTAESDITEEGVTYDYAATLVNNLPNDKVMKLNYSLLNIPTQAVKIAVMAALTSTGVSAAKAVLGKGAAAFNYFFTKWAIGTSLSYGSAATGVFLNQMGWSGVSTLTSYLLSIITSSANGMIATKYLANKVLTGSIVADIVTEMLIRKTVKTSYNLIENYISSMLASNFALSNTKGLKTTTFENAQLDGIGNTNDYPNATSIFSWYNMQKTRTPYVIYKMYIKELGDLPKGKMNIYNDVGSVYNYRTVAIGENAINGNKNLKSIEFTDVYGKLAESYVPLHMVVPDYAFKNCENLETLDMFIRMKYHVDEKYPLGPQNFMLLGEHVFDNCPKLKIRIASEKYEEFANDSIWSKYKDRFEIVDWKEKTAFSERGCSYAYNLIGNSLLDKDDKKVWNVHVAGSSDKNSEEIDIATDPGTVNSYHTTYVAKKAFYGHNSLKKIHFWDMTTNLIATNKNHTVDLELQDSCFANCKSLENICMMYHTYEGSNNLLPLSPENVKLGKDVFAGCPENFKILVAAEVYGKYIVDPFWQQYAKHIIPFFYKPTDISVDKVLESGSGNFDGYKLYDYRIPCKLKTNKAMDKTVKSSLNSFEEYSLLSYIQDSNSGYNKSVPEAQFANFENLQKINLPYTIERIETRAFENTALYRVQLNQMTTEIGASAFKNCKKLKVIEMHSDKPSSVKIDETAFDGVPSDYVISVPDTLVNEYKAQLPFYASHINGHSAYPVTTGLVTFTSKNQGDLVKHFKQEIKIGYHTELVTAGNVSVTINGYPMSLSGGDDSWMCIDSLKIVGPIDQSDVTLLSNMSHELGCLSYLDLSEAYMQYHKFKYTDNGKTKDVDVSLIDQNGHFTTWFDEITDAKSIGCKSFSLGRSIFGQNLTTLLYSKDYFSGIADSQSAINKIVFPADFAGFSHFGINTQTNIDIAFLGNEIPSTEFLSSKKANVKLYVPYQLNTTYQSAENYGKRVASINSLFYDDEAFATLAKVPNFMSEADMSMTDTLGIWFKENQKVKNLDELHRFSNVTVIPENAFKGCSSLERIAIPYNVRAIQNGAFDGCSSLKSITMLADTVPTLKDENTLPEEIHIFDNLPEDFKIYVSDAMLEKYLTNPQWTKYRQHIVSFLQTDDLMLVTVDTPGELASKLGIQATISGNKLIGFDGSNIKDVRRLKINGPITDVDLALLHYLSGRWPSSELEATGTQLRYLDLSDAWIVKPSGTSCRVANYNGATVDENDVLPKYTFYDCDHLEKLILPRTVKKIAPYSLSKCNILNTVVLGEKLEEVSPFALEDSPRLVSLAITSKTVPAFSDKAFGSTAGVLYNKHNFVERVHTARSIRKDVAATDNIQQHALRVDANFDDDAMYRTLALHCVLDTVSASLVKNIDGWFKHNEELKDARQLRVFDGLASLEDFAFKGCSKLEKIATPKNISSVGDHLYSGCDELLYIDMTRSKNLKITDFSRTDGIFADVPVQTLVYMPCGNESQFDDINVIGSEEQETNEPITSVCRDYRIYDNNSTIDVPYPFHAEKATVLCEFEATTKTPIFLPYGLDSSQADEVGKFYEFTGYDHAKNEVVFTRVEQTKPNTAYMLMPADKQLETTNVDVNCTKESFPEENGLVGIYHLMQVESNPWAYEYTKSATNENGARLQGESFIDGNFVKMADGSSIKPLRAYLQLKSLLPLASSFSARFIDNRGTIIEPILRKDDNHDSLVNIYSTEGKLIRSGVKLSEGLQELPHGIYVVNGKKYMK